MDWSQALFGSGIIAAVLVGLPPLRVCAVIVCAYLATMALAASPTAVGVADLICASILATGSRREQSMAALFAVMPVVYVAGGALGFHNSTIYAIVDLIAYGVLMIVGSYGGGADFIRRMARKIWAHRGRRADPAIPAAEGLALGASRTRNSETENKMRGAI